jgi:hypothetical protein
MLLLKCDNMIIGYDDLDEEHQDQIDAYRNIAESWGQMDYENPEAKVRSSGNMGAPIQIEIMEDGNYRESIPLIPMKTPWGATSLEVSGEGKIGKKMKDAFGPDESYEQITPF